MAFGERRGLPKARPTRRIELIVDTLVAAFQPIALAFSANQYVAQPIRKSGDVVCG